MQIQHRFYAPFLYNKIITIRKEFEMLVNLDSVLYPAKQNKYGVGLFNTVNSELARSVIESAEETGSPVIIGTAEVLLPCGSLEMLAGLIIPMARNASVPVVVHYDHGLTFEKCIEAIRLGFTSIMYDCSTLPYEENIRQVAEMVKTAHAAGVTVEGELGHVGDNEGAGRLNDPKAYFTDPDRAAEYAGRTGIDALAVAVGNAHGDYRFPPKLDFDRIQTIASAVKVPLVLHGGSGLSDDDFRTAIRMGISKINIFTDIDKAAAKGARSALEAGSNTLTGMIPYEITEVKKVVKNKMELFDSIGKA